MKTKTIALAAALLALGNAAFADVTVYLTGATAFRTATLNTISNRFANAGTPSFTIATDSSAASWNSGVNVSFRGNFPGVAGVTTIHASFNGSVEGIQAITTTDSDPTYFPDSVFSGASNSATGVILTNRTDAKVAQRSDIAFSDVSINSTPYKNSSVLPGADSKVGAIVFTMLGNEGTDTNTPYPLSNITSKQFRALLEQGRMRLSFFNGETNSLSTNTWVYLTGRNDGSGTRTVYTAETGHGFTKLANQYIVGAQNTNGLGNITAIYLAPRGGTNAVLNGPTNTPVNVGNDANGDPVLLNGLGLIGTNANASTTWGQDVDGNGGYFSGSQLRTPMGYVSTNVTVYQYDSGWTTGSDGSPLITVASNTNLYLVTWVSIADAVSARGQGAKILGFNGVRLDNLATNTNATSLTGSDLEKVARGAYTAWSWQQMYRRSDISGGDKLTVFNAIRDNISGNIGSAGIPTTSMRVARTTDGGVVK